MLDTNISDENRDVANNVCSFVSYVLQINKKTREVPYISQ
jgi:hypothetical protein